MKRRGVIAFLGWATLAGPTAVLAPIPAFAQETFRLGVVGARDAITEKSPPGAALLRGLAQHGYVPGRNLVLESRGAEGRLDRLPRLVEELVAGGVRVIIANGYPAAIAAKRATTLPIVAINAGDPIGTGLVESLARPGGNMTGISDVSAELTPKRMELLKLMVPNLRRLAILWNASDLGMTLRYQAMTAGAKAMDIEVQPLGVREPEDFEGAFTAMDKAPPDAMLMVTDSLTNLNRKRIFDYAAAHHLPTIYEFDMLVRDGGLMSYGPDFDESFGRVAALVDRILRGAKPGDLPFEEPRLFKFVINLKTAKALGLTVPEEIFARVDEVIE